MSSMGNTPTEIQRKIAAMLGIEIDGYSKRTVAAALRAALAEDVLDIVPTSATSESQRDIAAQLGINNLSDYKEIAGLQIGAAFTKLNEEASAKYKFIAGMCVEFIGGPHVHDFTYNIGDTFVISSLGKDGRVYFKGGGGQSAHPSQLRPCSTNQCSE